MNLEDVSAVIFRKGGHWCETIRLIHMPTGFYVEVTDGISLYHKRNAAMEMLESILERNGWVDPPDES